MLRQSTLTVAGKVLANKVDSLLAAEWPAGILLDLLMLNEDIAAYAIPLSREPNRIVGCVYGLHGQARYKDADGIAMSEQDSSLQT
jgi:hypothetical protein